MSMIQGYSDTLTKVGVKYIQDPANFLASKIFPSCPVITLSGTFPTYDKEYWMKNEAKIRTPGTISEGGQHARGFDSYKCENVAYHEDVPDEYSSNDPVVLNSVRAATRRVTQKIAIYDEVDFCANFFVTGKWGTAESTPDPLWSAADSFPLEDVDAAKRIIKIATSYMPNKMVMAEAVYDIVKRHPQIKDQIKYTSSANVTPELLARLFEIESLVIMGAVYDSARFGATAVQQYVAADNVLLLHTTNSPSLEEPSAGYNFTWNGFGTNGYGARKLYLEEPMATRVEVHSYHQFKQVAADLGYMLLQPIA